MARRFSIFSTTNAENRLTLYDSDHIAGSMGHYNFEGNGVDAGPNGIDLTYPGSAVKYVEAYGVNFMPPAGDTPGARRCWYGTGGTNDFWLGPTGSAGDVFRLTGSMTCQVWAYYPATRAAVFVAQGQFLGGPVADNTLYIFQTTGVDKLLYGHEDAGGVFRSTTVTLFGLTTQAWNHVAFTRDDAGTEIHMYLNGALIHSATLSAPTTGGSNGYLEVGSYNGGSKWIGAITGVLIENVARTGEEIATNYRRGLLGY